MTLSSQIEEFTIRLFKKYFHAHLYSKNVITRAQLHKFKQKNFLGESENDKFYRSGSAPTRIYGTPKSYKVFSTDAFSIFHPIVSSTNTFNNNLACQFCDILSFLVPNKYSYKECIFFCFLNWCMQISQVKFLSLTMQLVCLLIFNFKKPLAQQIVLS